MINRLRARSCARATSRQHRVYTRARKEREVVKGAEKRKKKKKENPHFLPLFLLLLLFRDSRWVEGRKRVGRANRDDKSIQTVFLSPGQPRKKQTPRWFLENYYWLLRYYYHTRRRRSRRLHANNISYEQKKEKILFFIRRNFTRIILSFFFFNSHKHTHSNSNYSGILFRIPRRRVKIKLR